MNDTRAKILAAAPTVVGLDADPADPEGRRAYIALIAPGESASDAAEMASLSGCGFVVAGLWRTAGVEDARLDPPYRIGTAISRLVAIAQAVGAWVPFAAKRFPEPGDMVLVGDGDDEHVFTVTAITVDAAETARIESVDGGQRDAREFETILARSRSWSGSSDTVAGGSTRRIIGWIDAGLLPTASASALVASAPVGAEVAMFSTALPDEPSRSRQAAPADTGAPGADSLKEVTDAAIALATTSLGAPPAFWGRYFSTPTGGDGEYSPGAESAILRAAGIPVLPLARQTGNVGGSADQGESDGRANAAALLAAFGAAYLVSLGGEILMFLDVEGFPSPSLSAGYYEGWCKGLASVGPAITIRPCVYAIQSDEATWRALDAAAAAGTPCHGIWMAHWLAPAGVPVPLGAWSEADTAPHPQVAAPVLLWQYAAGIDHGTFDCNQVNPALDLQNDLLRYLVLPPA